MHPLRQADLAVWRWPGSETPPPMDHEIGGRKPSQYSDAMARIILARLDRGETVASLTADPDMPSYRTLYDWRARHEDFGAAWDELRSDQSWARRRKVQTWEADRAAWEALRAKAEGRAPRRKAGRKSTYTPERAAAFCALIDEGGLTLRQAAAQPGMPAVAMVYRWLRNHPEFRAAYVKALWGRDDRLDFEVLLTVDASTPANFPEAKRRVEALEGRMGALRPDVWHWW